MSNKVRREEEIEEEVKRRGNSVVIDLPSVTQSRFVDRK
jgi:hypothetical protein